MYNEAIECYEKCLNLNPTDGSVYAAIGFTHHLNGDLQQAIEYYHKALGLKYEDSFTAEMLSKALQQQFEQPIEIQNTN